MRNLENYFEPPFESIKVGKEKITEFFDDHANALIQQSSGNATLAALVTPTNTALSDLKLSLGDTSVNVAEQKSKTLTVDQCIDLFVSKAKEFEASVRDKFGKLSPVYQEFYPQGMKPFNNISKASIESLMIQIKSAFFNHKVELGEAKSDELQNIYDIYVHARGSQEQKKSETKGSRLSWDDSFEAMKRQAFVNLLTIASIYPGEPERAKLFFNQSIITPKMHHTADGDTSSYILVIPFNSKRVADISFSPDDTLLIINNGTKSISFYAAATADAATPAILNEIAPGEELEITAATLGAPANKFLIFVNTSLTDEGEVEIVLV